ncbi:MAG: PadR family transcriptional regulator [Bryobacteraceae bacterium]
MEPKKSELLQGTLDLLILKTLLLDPLHGYGIAQRILASSREVLQVQQGSLYPALHRLERKGLIASEWKDSETARMAKYYALTKAGKAQLQTELEQWRRYARAIGWVLQS